MLGIMGGMGKVGPKKRTKVKSATPSLSSQSLPKLQTQVQPNQHTASDDSFDYTKARPPYSPSSPPPLHATAQVDYSPPIAHSMPEGSSYSPITIRDEGDMTFPFNSPNMSTSSIPKPKPLTTSTKPVTVHKQTPAKSDVTFGMAGSPIIVGDDSPAASTVSMKKKKKDPVALLASFPEKIQRFVEVELKPMVAKESFVPKNKFPPDLKPPLIELSWLALELDRYDDDFFLLLTTIFPYNQFTMKKLVKREIFDRRIKQYTELQQESERRLKDLVAKDFPRQKAAYEEQLREHSRAIANAEVVMHSLPTGEVVPGSYDVNGQWVSHQASEPKKKFKMSEEMKAELITMVKLENDMSELRSEKFELEKMGETWSDLVARKALYGRLMNLWPEEGWITTNDFSRFVSVAKKKESNAATGS
ncbi:hypothetical protein BT69DRAFT_413281 [Atractiella rhizophila]|nr:hypothetical protein BT69DRAFT_413281 [Atractiella rhizophila]